MMVAPHKMVILLDLLPCLFHFHRWSCYLPKSSSCPADRERFSRTVPEAFFASALLSINEIKGQKKKRLNENPFCFSFLGQKIKSWKAFSSMSHTLWIANLLLICLVPFSGDMELGSIFFPIGSSFWKLARAPFAATAIRYLPLSCNAAFPFSYILIQSTRKFFWYGFPMGPDQLSVWPQNYLTAVVIFHHMVM